MEEELENENSTEENIWQKNKGKKRSEVRKNW